MGLGEKLKDLYYAGEEKWYDFWDKVDSHLPIYKIIDPIDSIVPSFALFLILIFILLLILSGVMFGAISSSQTQVTFQVVDSSGSPVEGVTVDIAGVEKDLITNEFGLTEKITLGIGQYDITAKKGDREVTDLIYLEGTSDQTVQLELSSGRIDFTQKSIMFKTENGDLATGELHLTFACSSGITEGVPSDQYVFGGTTNIAQPESCGTLTVSVSSPKYNTETFTVSGLSGNFVLTEKVSKSQVKAVVNLTYEGKNISDSVTVQAFSTSQGYVPIDTEIAVNGQAQFDLLEGDYTFKTAAEKGYKASANSPVVSLTKEGGQKSITIALEKQYLGSVRAVIKEGTKALSGVRVALAKETASGTTQEIWAYDTNASGMAEFDVAEEGPFVIIATKDGYCDKSIEAEIGDEVILSLKKYDGTCGHELKVRVIDSDGKPVQFAKVAIFSETTDDLQKLSYVQKVTDFNGEASWSPVRKSIEGEKFKVFAFKSVYSGWSEAKELNATTSSEEFIVRLEIPLGTVRVIAKDMDGDPLQFSEVQIFDEYAANPVSGKRMIESIDGSIDFNIKADKMVYAVVKREGYESFTTIPKQIIGNGTIVFEAQLSRPPVEELVIRPLGFYKGGMRAQKVEANQEYDVLFEITAPKSYDELGFFVRVGKDYTTKTEMDKIFIKEVYAGGDKTVLTGGTYNKPRGYSIDEAYLNLEENKWAQVVWEEGGFVQGKIIVGVKVKIRQTALQEERIDLGYRAWGVIDGDYERDPFDSELGTSENKSGKQALYALTKPDYITVGVETLCDKTTEERSFCITATYTDTEGFTHSFNDSFDSLNNTPYSVSINVMNNSLIGFDNAKIMIENPEENIMINGYTIKTPRNETRQAQLGGYKTEWIDVSGFNKGLSIDIMDMNIIPQKTGSGTLVLKIREQNSLIFEKTFTINIASDKKMDLTYMNDGTFKAEMPKVISGKFQIVTIKAKNVATGLEISDAIVKLYDRFGTKLFTTTTNALGVAPIDIPASFPAEKLTIKVEKAEYETFVKEFSVEEDVVSIEPTELTFTVNPQTNKEDIQTVKISNKTGLDLTIKEIKLTGKLKGVLSESQIESWFDQYIGTKILSQDYEEIDFKVISSDYVPIATDLEGIFQVTLFAEGKSWVQEVNSKIRVGLGKDVDDQACLQVTPTSWETQSRGNMVELGLELKNNCTVDKKPVQLKNLGLSLTTTGSVAGDFTAIYKTAQVEISTAYSKVLKPTLVAGEKVPIILRFTPLAGSSGTATGSIIFEAINNTDSAPQEVTAEVKFNIDYENLQDCMSVGTGLVAIDEGQSGTFAIINGCKFSSEIQLDLGDMQAAVSEKTFTLKAGETKEVQLVAQEGQMPGAYNILVKARQPGSAFELLDNVKVIISPVNSCFTLTRYEYDVYDSEFNNFDGIDRGYIKNTCVEKSVSANVSGTVPFDNWQSILTSALIGGIAGGVRGGKMFPDWISNLWSDDSESKSAKVDKFKAETQGRLGEQAMVQVQKNEADRALMNKQVSNNLTGYDTLANDADGILSKLEKSTDPKCKEFIPKVQTIKTDIESKKDSSKTELAKLTKEFDTINQDVRDNQVDLSTDVEDKADEWKANIAKGKSLGTKEAPEDTTRKTLREVELKGKKSATESKEKSKEILKKGDQLEKKVKDDVTAIQKDLIKLKGDCKSCLAAPATGKTTPTTPGTTEDGENQRADQECKENKTYFTMERPRLTSADKIFYAKDESACDFYQAFNNITNESAETQGVCCLNKEGPTSMCVVAEHRIDGLKGVFAITKDKDCKTEGYFDKTVEKFPAGYKCCAESIVTISASEVPNNGGEKVGADYSPYVNPNAAIKPMSLASSYLDSEGNEVDSYDEASFGFTEYTSLDSTSSNYCEYVVYAKNYTTFVTEDDTKEGCASLSVDVEDFTRENEVSGFCKYSPETDQTEGVYELDCAQGTNTIYKVVADEGTSLIGYASSTANGQAMLDAYSNSLADDSTSEDGTDGITPKYTEYRVKEGEDLYAVAIRWGVSPADLKSLNNLTGNELKAGSIIKIPTYNSADDAAYGVKSNSDAAFILASTSTNTTNASSINANNTTSIQDVMGNGLFNVATSAMVGMMGGSFLGGAALSALLALMQAEDTEINYSETFFVPKVVMTGFELESQDGITVNSFDKDQKIYEYSGTDKGVISTANTDEDKSTADIDSSYAGTVLYDPQTLNATVGLEELIELEFSNPGKKVNRSPNEPFVGVLTVTGQEAIYDKDYNYDYVKEKAEADGEDLTIDREGFFGTILDYIGGPGLKREETAEMDEDYLTVDEIKAYKKQFHLLFDSYEYVDCGPNTYPCTQKALSNCDVDGKNGYTGEEGIPKMKLAWNWNEIGINECDSDANPDEYNYCDTTQFSIMLLKRLMEMKEFFNSTSLTSCPSSAEIAGTKTQDLAENDLDVAITSVEVKSQASGAIIKSIVQTNNNLEMSAKMTYVVKDADGNEVTGVCAEETKTFKSSAEYYCELSKSTVGEGTFNVDLIMTPTLCSGCGNRSTGNDTIRTSVIIGSSGASQCLKYATSKDYFEKVLSANNLLGTSEANKVLGYISFKANLLRDGFSSDFKADFDEYLNRITSAPVEYTTGGFRELLLSDKFAVKWPEKPAAWEAGKYDATITVTFKNENWKWDNNNIESISVNLSPQGPPEPDFAIYNVAFNGVVGLDSDNGRQGYGAGYEQMTEDLFLIANDEGTRVYARPNSSNNASTTVRVSTIKGNAAFDVLNSVPTRGNVLSISGREIVEFVLTPSIAVPIIMDVTRNTSTDAYAFYSAEVNGSPQNTGGSFISWTGIGQGCVDFEGRSMSSYSNTYDTLASGSVTGFTGYGLPAWTMAQRGGTASFYGTFYAPQDSATVFKLIGANESAKFESTMGSGTVISVNPSVATDAIGTLEDVLELVKQEKVCVVGGDYYWNNYGLREALATSINSRESTCIPAQGN